MDPVWSTGYNSHDEVKTNGNINIDYQKNTVYDRFVIKT